MIPYLRFAWAGYLIINTAVSHNFIFNDVTGGKILFETMIRVVTVTFTLYCIIRGWEELKDKRFTHAIFFDIFGLLFEVIIFTIGIFVLLIVDVREVKLWRIASLVLFEIALITIIWTDVKKMLKKSDI
jgi:hypothetical protein